MDYETHKAIEDAQQTLADLSESLDLEGRKKSHRRDRRDHFGAGFLEQSGRWPGHHAGKGSALKARWTNTMPSPAKLEDLEVMIELAKEEPDADLEQDIVDTLAEITKELDAFELETILKRRLRRQQRHPFDPSRRWRHRKPGLGRDALSHVCALG